MDNSNKKLWFRARWFGWGWYPSSWEGGLVTVGYIVAVMLFALTVDDDSPPREVAFTFLLPVTLLTVAFIRICYAKGEKPRWRWMGRDVSRRASQLLWTLMAIVLLGAALGLILGLLA